MCFAVPPPLYSRSLSSQFPLLHQVRWRLWSAIITFSYISILQCGSLISFNPCLSFSCVLCCLIVLFSYLDRHSKLFVNVFPLISVFHFFLHPGVVCMPLHVCVCPIVLRIFDSVYLNVSYRRSWKDMEQETSEVGLAYSGLI